MSDPSPPSPPSVKTLEVSLISPPSHSPYSSFPNNSLPLTFFDILWLRFPPVHRLFFYQIPLTSSSSSSTFFFTTILPKLKHSLSLTLQHYLPLTGHITWPHHSHKPIIQILPTDTIQLTITESNSNFHQFSDNNLIKIEAFHPLLPPLQTSHDQASVASLQMTLFPNNSGFSIGITSHHAVMDGKTSTSFIKSWAQTCRLGTDQNEPFYDRTVVNDPLKLESLFLNELLNHNGPDNRSLTVWKPEIPPDMIRGTFGLTRGDISKLKNMFRSEKVSTFVMTSAYTWICLAKAEGLTDSKMRLAIPSDARSRLVPNLPSNYFGNCIIGVSAVCERNDLMGKDGFFIAAEAINEAVRNLDDGRILNGAERLSSIIRSVNNKNLDTVHSVKSITVGGSHRFGVYGADFGWGGPKMVGMTSIYKSGSFSVSDSRDGIEGGIEVGIVLGKKEMEAFATLFARGLE